MGGLLLVLIVVVVVVAIFGSKSESSLKALSPIEVSSKNKLCEVRGKFSGDVIEKGMDKDADGYPDDCDICLGGDNRVTTTNSIGIPDSCYMESTSFTKFDTYKKMCIARSGCYVSDKDQCCLGSYKSKCGSECKSR